MISYSSNLLRLQIEKIGWRSTDERLWSGLGNFHTVIIAPPLDTIPSPDGNAIYTLVEELVEGLPKPTLVLARWFQNEQPLTCGISDRILYDTNPLKAGWIEKYLPYRLKHFITGSGAPFYFNYARRAAWICKLLNIKNIIIEDIPVFAPVIKKRISRGQSLFLHQHSNAPKSIPRHYWQGVTNSLAGIVFVAKETWRETEQLHGKLKIPTRVIYNGVDLAKYDPQRWQVQAKELRRFLGIPTDDKVLLYTGRIVPHKGIAEAADAYISADIPCCHFVVVGDLEGSLFANENYTLRLRLAAEKKPKAIHLVGAVKQKEIAIYYAMADAVIIPSLGAEGLPKVITEALAMQTPCIVTCRGGALELIEDGVSGWVVPEPVSISNLAMTMKRAMNELGQVKVNGNTRKQMDRERMIREFAEFLDTPSALKENEIFSTLSS